MILRLHLFPSFEIVQHITDDAINRKMRMTEVSADANEDVSLENKCYHVAKQTEKHRNCKHESGSSTNM